MAGDELTLESFSPHVGSVFLLRDGEADTPLTPVAADALPAPPGDRGRPPFSSSFMGRRSRSHPQETVTFEHDAMGRLEMFIVPVGQDARHTRYQAIFV